MAPVRPREERLQVNVHGHVHEVSAGLLRAELLRDGPPPKLALIEAVIRHAPRGEALARLAGMLDAAAAAPGQGPVPGPGPGNEHAAMHAALGALGLSPDPEAPREAAALDALMRFGARVGGAAGATVRAGVILLREGPAALARRGAGTDEDDLLLLRQSPRAVCAITHPGPLVPHLRPLCAAWMAALDQAGKTMGAHGFRALLGDVSEALYRVLLRARPRCGPQDLLSEPERAMLLDLVAVELPSTADFLAARSMAWALGALGPLPPDDAGAAAIERARDRFANESFHADCAAILSGGPWPPGPERPERP